MMGIEGIEVPGRVSSRNPDRDHLLGRDLPHRARDADLAHWFLACLADPAGAETIRLHGMQPV